MTPSPLAPAKFVEGSIFRHVAVMAATGSIGLMAVFVVDALNLFYISLLGEEALAAAIGYAGTVMFFATSLCLGVMIAGSALVARALGAGDRQTARKLAGAALAYMLVVTGVLSLLTIPALDAILSLLGAKRETHEVARRFLVVVTASTPLLGIGMAASGILRALGDAQRAMWVTLSGGLVTAVLDPLLILWAGFGVDGAAAASVVSRLAMAAYGIYALTTPHRMLPRPCLSDMLPQMGAISGIALPAILTNVATPVGNAYITAALAPFGDDAVAAWAVIGRLIPVAFGPLFALTGAVGPILGQNLGARRYDRLAATLKASLTLTLAYVSAMWLVLALARGPLAAAFGLSPGGEAIVSVFCLVAAGGFIFLGALFVANAAFNNLGAPILSTAFNWGRATLGTIPFVHLGGKLDGAQGVVLGQALGSVAFGIAAMAMAFRLVSRIAATGPPPKGDIVPAVPEMPPLASPLDASAIDP